MSEENLVQELAAERERANRAERQLARVEGSVAMTVGHLVVDAGQDMRKLIRLPMDLLRIRRSRRAARARAAASPASRASAGRAARDVESPQMRLLIPRRRLTPTAAISVVGVLRDETAALLEPYVALSRVLPHDAAPVMAAVDADLVLIESAAGEPGHPWFPLGRPGAADREQALIGLHRAARGLGRPVVMVFDQRRQPGLTEFAALCELVIPASEWSDTDGLRDPDPQVRREAFRTSSVPWRLQRIAEVLGIPARPIGVQRVTVIDADDRGDIDAILAAQSLQPDIVLDAHSGRAALADRRGAGAIVILTRDSGDLAPTAVIDAAIESVVTGLPVEIGDPR